MNIRDLIESVGGVRSAARLLGVAPSTAHYYCKTNRVPAQAAFDAGVSVRDALKGQVPVRPDHQGARVMNHDDRYFEVRALVKDESLRIKDIVKQTGYDKGHVSRLRKASRIDKLIADAVAAEREACARLCDQMFHDWCNQEFEDEDEAYRNKPDAEDCKKAIRARSNT
jgi:hypothetical protein